MSIEFTKTGPNMVTSTKGFTVVFHPPGGVDYSDTSGSAVHVDTELYATPLRHVLYAKSKDLRGMTSARADEILGGILRAMAYLGHPAEIFKE